MIHVHTTQLAQFELVGQRITFGRMSPVRQRCDWVFLNQKHSITAHSS
jgi:hypothetical protein